MNKLKMIGSSNGERNERDFYPTPLPVTVALLDFLDLPIQTIWEPAAGDHAISNVLKANGHNVISTDIISGTDYLVADSKAETVITNPPFSLADKFIIKAVNEASTIALLLKATYWHAGKRMELFRSHPPAYILPLLWRPNFFGAKATGAGPMDFIWTVWLSGKTDTRYKLLCRPDIKRITKIQETVNAIKYPDLY